MLVPVCKITDTNLHQVSSIVHITWFLTDNLSQFAVEALESSTLAFVMKLTTVSSSTNSSANEAHSDGYGHRYYERTNVPKDPHLQHTTSLASVQQGSLVVIFLKLSVLTAAKLEPC